MSWIKKINKRNDLIKCFPTENSNASEILSISEAFPVFGRNFIEWEMTHKKRYTSLRINVREREYISISIKNYKLTSHQYMYLRDGEKRTIDKIEYLLKNTLLKWNHRTL